MDSLIRDFKAAYTENNGNELAQTLSPIGSDRLQAIYRSTNFERVKVDFEARIVYEQTAGFYLTPEESNAWVAVYSAYWKAAGAIMKAEDDGRNSKDLWTKAFRAWVEVSAALHRGYNSCGFEAWTIPCLYIVGKYLRIFAIKADEGFGSVSDELINFQDDLNPEGERNANLEDAARQLNKFFQVCLSDRAPLETSRKWAIYEIINLLLKTYFKLNQVSLSKNVLKAVAAYRGDTPTLDMFPKSQQTTYKYYVGVIDFLEENYKDAESNLTAAWNLCHKDATRNKELILTYLIPCHLLTTHTLPQERLLAPYPRLQKLFLPLCRCIKSGDLAGFDAALSAGEEEFVRRRIYLTLERGRDIALRNLLRKVFIAGGFEEAKDPAAPRVRRTRIPVAEFAAAISMGSKEMMENDEVECLLANMIYKGHMKGYIAREAGKVVLSKGAVGAFPGTNV